MSANQLVNIGRIPNEVVEGEPVTFKVGWHVNSASWLPELESHRVEPATPYNVIAGATTYYYAFADEAEALSLLPELRAE